MEISEIKRELEELKSQIAAGDSGQRFTSASELASVTAIVLAIIEHVEQLETRFGSLFSSKPEFTAITAEDYAEMMERLGFAVPITSRMGCEPASINKPEKPTRCNSPD